MRNENGEASALAVIVIVTLGLGLLGLLTLYAVRGRPLRSLPSEPAASPLDAKALRVELRRAASGCKLRGSAPLRFSRREEAAMLRGLKALLQGDTGDPACTWLQAHSRTIEEAVRTLRRDLRRAPRLPKGPDASPRLLRLTDLLTSACEGLDKAAIQALTALWEESCGITERELRALSPALRLSCLRQLHSLLARSLSAQREQRAGDRLARRMARAAKDPFLLLEKAAPSPDALRSCLERLHGMGAADILRETETRLAHQGADLQAILRELLAAQALRGKRAGALTGFLELLDRLPWPALEEELDPLHHIFLDDPGKVYPRMTRESRREYCARAARLARLMGMTEGRVALGCVQLCAEAAPDGIHDHVGHYLLEDRGLRALWQQVRVKRGPFSLLLALRRHRAGLSRAAWWGLLVAGLWGFLLLRLPPALLLPLLLSLAWPVRALLGFQHSPRFLPEMDLGPLSEQQRTLLVLPVVLRSPRQALRAAALLSAFHHADPDPHIDCLLLGDLPRSMTREQMDDSAILRAATEAVSALNEAEGASFYYLQRQRVWSREQGQFLPREGRVGALETVSRLIAEGECADLFDCATVSPDLLHRRYAFVLAVEEDALLLPDVAHRLIGALSHPLNRRRMLGGVPHGFTILTPRLLSDEDPAASLTARLLSSPGSSSFACAVFTPEDLAEETAGWLCPGALPDSLALPALLCGHACAPGIVSLLHMPEAWSSYLSRLHLRARSAWQLLPWLFPWVKTTDGVRPNPLQNGAKQALRRHLMDALIPLGQVLLLLLSPLADPLWGPLAALGILLAGMLHPGRSVSLPQQLAALPLLPDRAVSLLYGAGEGLLWQLLPRRRPLPPLTAPVQEAISPLFTSPWSQWLAALALTGVSVMVRPVSVPGLLLAVLFALPPLLLPRLDRPDAPAALFDAVQDRQLQTIAEETWRSFTEGVDASTGFLPPRSVQTEPERGPELLATPGDMGLYLLSCVSAMALGLADPDEAARRIAATLDALERLPCWHGCPFSRYRLPDGAPEEDPVVLSTDCGYYLAGLLTAAQALRQHLSECDAALRDVPARLDALADALVLTRLYDADAGLFFVRVDAGAEKPSGAHHTLFSGEALLLSFLAVMRREVPPEHLSALSRTMARTGRFTALCSLHGTMAEALAPYLLLPLARRDKGLRSYVRAQMALSTEEGLWGRSECAGWVFGPDLRCIQLPFGLPAFSRAPGTPTDALAPYAAALALPLFPEESYEVLQRMRSRGMSGPLGFYESLDLSPRRTDGQAGGRIVYALFARHQAMLLCSLCQALTGGGLSRVLLSIPAASPALLLLRRTGRDARPVTLTLPPPPPPSEDAPAEALLRRPDPLRFPVEAHVLCGGGSCLLVSAQGDQLLWHGETALTRHDLRPGQHEGFQFYLRTGDSWWQPTDPTLPGDTTFGGSTAVFHREKDLLSATLTCLVDPASGAVLHLLDLTNLSTAGRMVEAADFLAPALRPEGASSPAQAPCLETLPIGGRGIAVPARAEGRCLAHTVFATVNAPLWRQSSRDTFLGRAGTPWSPLSLQKEAAEDLPRCPADPCVSLRLRLPLGGRSTARLIFLTGLVPADTSLREDCLRTDARAAETTLFLSRMHLRAVMAQADVTPAELDAVQCLTGALMWRGQPHQGADTAPLLPVDALRPLGIRPNGPLLCVTLTDPDGSLWRFSAKALTLLRRMGLPVQACFLLPGEPEEDGPLHHRLRDALDTELLGEGSGVVIGCSEDQAELLCACATLCLDDRCGSAEEQLRRLHYPVAPSPSAAPLSAPVPETTGEGLLADCGYGGFEPSGDAYAVCLPAGVQPPAPWRGLASSASFFTETTENGPLVSLDEEGQPLTAWSRDETSPEPSEWLLIRDEETGAVYSPARSRLCPEQAVRIVQAPGETLCVSAPEGLELAWQIFSDTAECAGCRALRLKELKKRKRRLTVLWCIRFASNTVASPVGGAVLAAIPGQRRVLCAAIPDEKGVRACAMCEGVLTGLWGMVPYGLLPARDDSRHAAEPPLLGADTRGTVAVLCCPVALAPGGSVSLPMVLACAPTADEAGEIVRRLQQTGLSARLRLVRRRWSTACAALEFHVPDPALSLMLDRVLPLQVLAPRPRQEVVPPLAALCLLDPDRARSALLRFAAGTGPQHALLLPLMTARYVSRTGDAAVLNVPITGPEEQPLPLRALCLRALRLPPLGPRGLPLSRRGSLLDEMAPEGSESIYLALALCRSLGAFAHLVPEEAQSELDRVRTALLAAVEAFGWDGAWYLRAVDGSDQPVGSAASAEYRVDLETQCLAALAGLPPERTIEALHQACGLLFDVRDRLTARFTPPFTQPSEGISASRCLPGTGPNGTQSTALTTALVRAVARIGEAEAAWTLARSLFPMLRADSPSSADRFRAEPYALPSAIATAKELRGRAFGACSAADASHLYCALAEDLLGLQKRGERVRLVPHVPPEWDAFALTLRFHSATYHLRADRDAAAPLCDGAPLADGWVQLADDGRIHEAVFPILPLR